MAPLRPVGIGRATGLDQLGLRYCLAPATVSHTPTWLRINEKPGGASRRPVAGRAVSATAPSRGLDRPPSFDPTPQRPGRFGQTHIDTLEALHRLDEVAGRSVEPRRPHDISLRKQLEHRLLSRVLRPAVNRLGPGRIADLVRDGRVAGRTSSSVAGADRAPFWSSTIPGQWHPAISLISFSPDNSQVVWLGATLYRNGRRSSGRFEIERCA